MGKMGSTLDGLANNAKAQAKFQAKENKRLAKTKVKEEKAEERKSFFAMLMNDMKALPQALVTKRAGTKDELKEAQIKTQYRSFAEPIVKLQEEVRKGGVTDEQVLNQLMLIGATVQGISLEDFKSTREGFYLSRGNTPNEAPIEQADFDMITNLLNQWLSDELKTIDITEGTSTLNDFATVLRSTRVTKLPGAIASFSEDLTNATLSVKARSIQKQLDTSFAQYTQDATKRYHRAIFKQMDPSDAVELAKMINEGQVEAYEILTEYANEFGLKAQDFGTDISRVDFAKDIG